MMVIATYDDTMRSYKKEAQTELEKKLIQTATNNYIQSQVNKPSGLNKYNHLRHVLVLGNAYSY